MTKTNKTKRVAIITGASTGIGLEISRTLQKEGYRLVLNSANRERLEKAAQTLNGAEDIVIIAGDIGEVETGRTLVRTAIKKFGRLDVLVNNAGIFSPKPFLEVDESLLDSFINVNLKGTYFTSQAAIAEMQKLGGGHIINIGSTLVRHALGGLPISAPMTAKAGIHSLAIQLAAEFGRDNIRVNTIAPGVIRTPIYAKTGIEDTDSLASLHLLGRVGETPEIAAAVLYLLNSDFVTGTELLVDGGQSAGHHIS